MKLGSILVLMVAGCAAYEPYSAPAPNITPAEILVSTHGYAVGAEPYADSEQQKKFFDADFQMAGIVVIQVIVENRTEQPVLVRRSTMLLTLPNDSSILPITAHSAAVRVGETGSVTAATAAFGLIGSSIASSAEDAAQSARISDYQAKEFKDVTLGHNESAHGFVFFTPPPGTGPFDAAQLTVRFVDVNAATSNAVRADLTGLDFPGAQLPE